MLNSISAVVFMYDKNYKTLKKSLKVGGGGEAKTTLV